MKERIKLHLFDFYRLEENYDAPVEVTQAGIAAATGIRVQHVGQYVKPLEAEGLVQERSSHIKGHPRRRKVYFLTAHGKQNAASLRSALLRETAPLRRLNGETEALPLSQIYQEVRRGTPLIALIKELSDQGCIAESLGEAPPAAVVDHSVEVPSVGAFYGRTTELTDVRHALAEVPLVVLAGIAGVGKTALAAKIRDELRGQRALFWRRIQPWDSAPDVLRSIADFLRASGRRSLFRSLQETAPTDLGRTQGLLLADMKGLECLLIFDDVQNASEECLTLFKVLHDVLKRTQPDTWTMVLSREVPGFYSRRDVSVDRSVAEFHLTGLTPDASRELLADSGVPDEIVPRLVSIAEGHPLFLRLLGASPGSERISKALPDLETYIAEEIVSELDADAQACMEAASLFQVPVPYGGILRATRRGKETLFQLRRNGLIDLVNGGVVTVHDRIRAYFREGLSPEREEALLARIVPWMLEEAERRTDDKDFDRAIPLLENVVAVDTDSARLRPTLQRLAFVRRHIGDWTGAVETYRQAIPLATEAMDRAWLHWTIAETHVSTFNFDEAEKEMAEVEKLISERPSLLRALLHVLRGWVVAFGHGKPEGALDTLEEVTGWVPTLPKDPLVIGNLGQLKGYLHLIVVSLWDPPLVLEELRRAVEAWRDESASRSIAESLPTEERALREHAVQFARSLRLPWTLLQMGETAIGLGRVEEGLAWIDESARLDEESGVMGGHVRVPLVKGGSLWRLGRFEEAEDLLERTLLEAKESDSRYGRFDYYRELSDLYYWEGRHQEALEMLEYWLTANKPTSDAPVLQPWRQVERMTLLVKVCTELGDLEAGKNFARKAEAIANEHPSAITAALASLAMATLHIGRGDLGRAESLLHEATRYAPRWLWEAETRSQVLLEYGECLAARGKRQEAIEALENARRSLLVTHEPMKRAIDEDLDSLEPA